jgi:site-specific recombinase XerD
VLSDKRITQPTSVQNPALLSALAQLIAQANRLPVLPPHPTVIPEPIETNPAAVYLAGLSTRSSRRTMLGALDTVAGLLSSGAHDATTLNWAALRYPHTVALRAKLVEVYAPSTANKMLSALRGVLKAAWRLGLVSAEDYRRAADLAPVSGETLIAGRDIGDDELAALMRVCEGDPGPGGARDAGMIGVLYICGLRRRELVDLDLGDYNRRDHSLHVRGKRNKERTVYLASGAVGALSDWLAIRGDALGALFWPIDKAGRPQRRRLSTQAVWKRVKRRAAQAGLIALSPHDFRRTFVGDLLDRGVDISTVSRLAGHSSVETTARYDRRPERVKRAAAMKLELPYHGRASPARDRL